MHKQALEICVKYRGYVRLSDGTGLYLSWCPMLDIKSQGTSIEQARASLDDSVRLFVVHCCRRGILERTLERLGLQEVEDDGSGADGEEMISVRPVPATKPIVETWEGSVPVRYESHTPAALSAE